MDIQSRAESDSGTDTHNVSEVHNPSVDEDAARQGACAQIHLPTGSKCVKRHGHLGSCEFTPPRQADELLAQRKAVEHW